MQWTPFFFAEPFLVPLDRNPKNVVLRRHLEDWIQPKARTIVALDAPSIFLNELKAGNCAIVE